MAMRHYNINSDQALFEAMINRDQSTTQPYLFENNTWQFTTSSCAGVVSNVLLSKGVALTVYNFITHHPIIFKTHSIIPRMIELGFVTSGIIQMKVHGSRREFDALPGQNYASLIEGEITTQTVIPAKQQVQMIEVRFTPQALDDYCDGLGCSMPIHLRKRLSTSKVVPYNYASILTQKMQVVVNQILDCRLDDTSRHFFLEGICLELVSLYMSFANKRTHDTKTSLSPQDIERVREAHYILRCRLTDPPSLRELSRLVNLNDFKLKLGFRQAFGTTAFSYLKEIRLQRAYELLRDQNQSVTEAALAVGYGNIGDFGIAFKRRFGILPKQARQGKKSVSR